MPAETVTLAFRRYRTEDGRATCGAKEGRCEFLEEHDHDWCWWGVDGVRLTIARGVTEPHEGCQIWRDGR